MTHPTRPDDEFRFSHDLRVRWTEVDLQGVVFFGHYYAFFDVAQAEYFRALGFPYPGSFVTPECDLFIRKSDCEYFGSARYDDELAIGARVAAMGRSSLTMACAVRRGDETLASGEIVYVFANPETRSTQAIPADLRAAITAYEPVDRTGATKPRVHPSKAARRYPPGGDARD